MQKKCVEFKDGCKDEKAAKEAIKQKQLAKIVEHFNEKYELGLETMGKKLAADIEYDSDNINKLVFLNYGEHIKYDLTKYTLGLSATVKRKDGLTKVLKWFIGDIVYSNKVTNTNNVLVNRYIVKSQNPVYNEEYLVYYHLQLK